MDLEAHGNAQPVCFCLPSSETLNPWQQSTFPGGLHSLHGETGQQQSHLTPEPAPPKGQGGSAHFHLLSAALSSVLLEVLTQSLLLVRLCLMWAVRWCSWGNASTPLWPTQKLNWGSLSNPLLAWPSTHQQGCGSSQLKFLEILPFRKAGSVLLVDFCQAMCMKLGAGQLICITL